MWLWQGSFLQDNELHEEAVHIGLVLLLGEQRGCGSEQKGQQRDCLVAWGQSTIHMGIEGGDDLEESLDLKMSE